MKDIFSEFDDQIKLTNEWWDGVFIWREKNLVKLYTVGGGYFMLSYASAFLLLAGLVMLVSGGGWTSLLPFAAGLLLLMLICGTNHLLIFDLYKGIVYRKGLGHIRDQIEFDKLLSAKTADKKTFHLAQYSGMISDIKTKASFKLISTERMFVEIGPKNSIRISLLKELVGDILRWRVG